MKRQHNNELKLPHSLKKRQKEKYEYTLPQDEMRLVADVCAIAAMRAVEDFPAEHTREEVEKNAAKGCENMKTLTHAEELTNDFDRLLDIAKRHYTESYLAKIADYKKDAKQHINDKNRIKEIGWTNIYNALRKMILQEFEANYQGVL